MKVRRPAPLEADADETTRVVWLLAELQYQSIRLFQQRVWLWLAVALNLAACALNLWLAFT